MNQTYSIHVLVFPFYYIINLSGEFQDRFSKNTSAAVCQQVTYKFLVPCLVPRDLWSRAISRIASFHRPLHVWQHGLVILEGIVEILVAYEGKLFTCCSVAIQYFLAAYEVGIVIFVVVVACDGKRVSYECTLQSCYSIVQGIITA